MRDIPFAQPALGYQELRAVERVFETGWLGLGPETRRFEREFAARMGAKFAVAVSSGTAALHLGLLVGGVEPDDEVLVPAITFISTAHAVSYCGAKPVFVDIEPDTLHIDLEDAEKRITPRTKAIAPVHYGGYPCKLDQIWRFAEDHNLVVIEDAAHACGAIYKGRFIGNSKSKAVCFSFDPIKNLTSIEGGMILVSEPELEVELRILRNLGREAFPGIPRWADRIERLGFRYHMNDVAAAVGRIQLKQLKSHNWFRRRVAVQYDQGFENLPWLGTPPQGGAYFNYVIKVKPPGSRTKLAEFLRDRGISTGLHYMPLHLHRYYLDEKVSLPVAEKVWTQLLTLPMHPRLKKEDVDRIVGAVREFGRGL